jgi:hypothetical protein
MNRLRNNSEKAVPYTVASKNPKWLRTNLTKEMKDLYNKNCRSL